MANIDRIGAVALLAAGLILASCSSAGGSKTAAGSSTTGSPPPPSTATTVAVSPSSLLLGAGDLAGYTAAPQPGSTPIPCGSHFGDTSTSLAQGAAAFATAGSQQTVKETVAIYPSAAAAGAVATSFRTAGPSCAQFDDTNGPTTTYQVRTLTAPAVNGDDVVAVALASPAHFYDLVLLRSGARLAWLAVGQIGNPVDPAVFTSVTAAAAQRLVTP
jgi:hypothetical protein